MTQIRNIAFQREHGSKHGVFPDNLPPSRVTFDSTYIIRIWNNDNNYYYYHYHVRKPILIGGSIPPTTVN